MPKIILKGLLNCFLYEFNESIIRAANAFLKSLIGELTLMDPTSVGYYSSAEQRTQQTL